MIKIKHNFDSSKFKWLWSKYVAEGNDKKHCTNCLKGKYSKKFSKHNENFNNEKITDHINEGYLIYEASCYGKKQMINQIMSMGSFCEVLEPESLKEEIIIEYENVLKNIYNRTI